MNIKLIVLKNERIKTFMIHRMLCFNYDKTFGGDSFNLKTIIKIDGNISDIIEQKQRYTNISEALSFDFLRHYLVNEYDEYDEEIWGEMNDGDHKVINIEVETEVIKN